ncbi:hypothetical protein U8607_22150 [Methylobacterium durans]|uniref:hypothetical protein n=1 Tax=Methylobacterium durans TaxID=2202825 RepID=UPI002AFE68F3|nr:hypothetical protein [Methylobacterium durans]MEA1834801.1 hypothetical protein [Methylobacterium durans]
MRFFVDFDRGDLIRFWMTPDNPTAIGRVAVSVGGRRVAEVPATIVDPNIRAFGWHATGQCTYELTEAEVPGLPGLPELEIHDLDTNLLIYRRASAEGLCQSKVLLINTGIKPETVIQGLMYKHFQQSYFGLGKLTEDMLRCIFESGTIASSFLSGSIVVPRYENFLPPDQILTAALIHDPHVEMATRMLWLRAQADLGADPGQVWRLGRLAEAATFMTEFDLLDLKSLKRLFRLLPEPAYRLLYNPLTRQLGTRLPDDRVHPGNSIVAVEILSRIGIVGHRDAFEAFVATLLDRLEIQDTVPAPEPIPADVIDLAGRLRQVRPVDDMLIFDTVMADVVRSSVAKAWTT